MNEEVGQKIKIVIHSENFYPTFEACKILDIDTCEICKILNKEATQALLQQVDSRIFFTRYDSLTPYKPYCEEIILLEIQNNYL